MHWTNPSLWFEAVDKRVVGKSLCNVLEIGVVKLSKKRLKVDLLDAEEGAALYVCTPNQFGELMETRVR